MAAEEQSQCEQANEILGVHSEMRVLIGDQKNRWDRIKARECLLDDTATAKLLLDCYEKHWSEMGNGLHEALCNRCHRPKSCPSCFTAADQNWNQPSADRDGIGLMQSQVLDGCDAVSDFAELPVATGLALLPSSPTLSASVSDNGGIKIENHDSGVDNDCESQPVEADRTRKRISRVFSDNSQIMPGKMVNHSPRSVKAFSSGVSLVKSGSDIESAKYGDIDKDKPQQNSTFRRSQRLAPERSQVVEAELSHHNITLQPEVNLLPMEEANICSECGKIIVDRKGLRKHQWEQHGLGDPSQFFTCSLCQKRFALANQYCKHMLQRHKRKVDLENPHRQIFIAEVAGFEDTEVKRSKKKMGPSGQTGQRKRQCDECGQAFPNLRALRKHHRDKHPERFATPSRTKCSECDNVYSELKTLRHHLFETHGIGDASVYYTCKVCSKRFCQQKRFVSHMSLAHGLTVSQAELTQPRLVKMALRKQAITCSDCGRYCHDRQRLNEHRKKEHEYVEDKTVLDHPYICCTCAKHFSSQGHLDNHVKKVHVTTAKTKWSKMSLEQLDEELVQNFVGNKLYATKEYKTFMKVYTLKNGSHCPLCKRKFDKLSVHMATHMPVLPAQCTQCPEKFSCNARLNYHVIKVHHPERQLVCWDCGKRFIVPGQLQYHQRRRHLKQKNVVCQHCGAAFFGNQELKAHCSIHHNNANRARHLCTVCGETYANVYTLRAHVKTHSDAREKTFACDKCPKKFYSLFTLQQHVTLTHSDLRPHVCSHCGKGFKTKQHLAGHERIHTGARPYACEDCGRSFISSTRRLEHRRKVHSIHTKPPVRPFGKCQVIQDTAPSLSPAGTQHSTPLNTATTAAVASPVAENLETASSLANLYNYNLVDL